MLELLAPAGSPEAVVAAVQNGADAVYLGLGGFNARQGAKNFTDEEFLDAVKYCHERGCRVYVTLNTLCADREMADLAALAVFVSDAGADAALRLLLYDAAEARAAALAAAADTADTDDADDAAIADAATETDWDSLSFADALLAWQEAPLAGLDENTATF